MTRAEMIRIYQEQAAYHAGRHDVSSEEAVRGLRQDARQAIVRAAINRQDGNEQAARAEEAKADEILRVLDRSCS